MKNKNSKSTALIIAVSMLLNLSAAYSVYAGDVAPPPAQTLKDLMKQIGEDFKELVPNARDPKQSEANAQLATEVVDLLTLAHDKTPDTITKLPPAQRAQALKSYQDQIKNMIALVQELAQDFQTKKLVAVPAQLNKIKDAKQNGHDDFKPEDP